MSNSTTAELLVVQNITRQFGAVRALDGVSLTLAAGQVHCVIGENGAGKSTLMKILAGIERPDGGRLLFGGKEVALRSVAEAQKLGVTMIHQELNLIDELTVAENIFLGRERHRLGFINHRWARTRAAAVLESLNCEIDPDAKVRDLSIASKQMVEIAKAVGEVESGELRVASESKPLSELGTLHSALGTVLIMDEPTAVLTRREVDALFGLINRLKSQGVAIVYISHILPEVLAIGDRVTVMRDGRVVQSLGREEALAAGEQGLASLMVGRPMGDHFPPRGRPEPRVVIEVRGLSVPGKVHDASFAIRAGEVLGFAGLIGAGRTELAEAIVGLRKRSAGQVVVNDRPINPDGPRQAARVGVAYVSEDRKSAGLTLGMGVVENTTMVSLKRYCHPFISRWQEEAATREKVQTLRIKIGRPRDDVATLSGGNQQKVALAKWLEVAPKVLIIDEPTRGVDVGAKEQIYALIRALTAGGMACMLISSELNEVIGLSDRIVVMRGGRLVATMDATDATEQKIMFHAAGVA
jgi:ribose transport system ATP-binding protein